MQALARGAVESFPQEELPPEIAKMIVPRKFEPPMRVQISRDEQDHHRELRRRSYELAVERGHIVRT